MPLNRFDFSITEIQERLADGLRDAEAPYSETPFLSQLFNEPPRPAAVLLPLLRRDNHWCLLFTRRNASLPEHSGQVAFPGGRADPGDGSPEGTALRESEEEIGLHPADVTLLGRLPPFLTITNYLVTPVVGVIPWPYPLRLSEFEVERAFTIPLDWLADPANYEEQPRALPAPFQPVNVIYYHLFDGEILWGASARFTQQFLKTLSNSSTGS